MKGNREPLETTRRKRGYTRALVRRRDGFARHPDEDLVHRHALAGMTGNDVAVRQMPEIPVDDPAVIDDDVAASRESLHAQQ